MKKRISNRPPANLPGAAVLLAAMLAGPAAIAAPFTFSSGAPDGQIGTLAQQGFDANGGGEVETADDFVLTQQTLLTGGSFTGLVVGDGDLSNVIVEFYRVFPGDSQLPPSGRVPTRENSPADVDFASFEAVDGAFASVNAVVLQDGFSVTNSIGPDGINPIPDQTTGGDGPLSGTMTAIEFVFNEALLLEAGQYFFVPRVAFDEPGPNGDIAEFYWLSSAKPIDASGTPFDGDLQSWIRDEDLQPDWLRVGTDVIGAGAFNAAFTLDGETVDADVPLPAPVALMTLGLLGFTLRKRTAR